jgi:hypothetical protein
MGEAWQALSHYSNILRTEDVRSSYTSVNFYQNTRSHLSEDVNIYPLHYNQLGHGCSFIIIKSRPQSSIHYQLYRNTWQVVVLPLLYNISVQFFTELCTTF